MTEILRKKKIYQRKNCNKDGREIKDRAGAWEGCVCVCGKARGRTNTPVDHGRGVRCVMGRRYIRQTHRPTTPAAGRCPRVWPHSPPLSSRALPHNAARLLHVPTPMSTHGRCRLPCMPCPHRRKTKKEKLLDWQRPIIKHALVVILFLIKSGWLLEAETCSNLLIFVLNQGYN